MKLWCVAWILEPMKQDTGALFNYCLRSEQQPGFLVQAEYNLQCKLVGCQGCSCWIMGTWERLLSVACHLIFFSVYLVGLFSIFMTSQRLQGSEWTAGSSCWDPCACCTPHRPLQRLTEANRDPVSAVLKPFRRLGLCTCKGPLQL